MANTSTETSVQILENNLADKSVWPYVVRRGMMGKASDNSWYNMAVNTDGTLVSGLAIPTYDYVSMALSVSDTTETYTLKTGGSGGTTVATVVVVYTDSSRDVLSTVTKT